MNPVAFAALEGFDSSTARKKRLGQYFSGLPVSKLLVALAAQRPVRTVCDPMGGRGDMLRAARSVIPTCVRTDGVEIDPVAHGECVAALRETGAESMYLLGNAFDEAVVSGLAPEGYDLVATNPPYVRYQSQKFGAGQSVKLPSALEVRNGLRSCLARLPSLSAGDRADFLSLVEGYSGLSDLAVPSWILCAALVKPGGTLAMVVPDAWLNRDYSAVVRYLLLRWFRIEYVVEDVHAAWFPDALVKTTLLVAHRIQRIESLETWHNETYLHVALSSHLANDASLVGRSRLGRATSPERAFARQARAVAAGRTDELTCDVAWQRIRLADQAAAVARSAAGEAWFARLEPRGASVQAERFILPPVLATWFGRQREFTTLDEIGVEVGQGLRTGANDFFYVEVTSRAPSETTVRTDLGHVGLVRLPTACVLPVVRRQADVSGSFTVSVDALPGAVLAFHGWALPEHAAAAQAQALSSEAAIHLRAAEQAQVGAKPLPSLTAVAPNVRKPNPKTGAPARFWYMLPDFAPRHRPDLLVARVNTQTPRVVLNPQRRALVDANFSTLWLRPDARATPWAVLAFLNSSLAAALFEHTGAVMGAGALKLEATHLRSLPVPKLALESWARLDGLGAALATAAPNDRLAWVRRIDLLLCEAMFGSADRADKVAALHTAIEQRQAARIKHHDASTRSRSPDVSE